MKYLICLFTLSFLLSCNKNKNKKTFRTPKSKTSNNSTNRIDSLVKYCIKTTKNKLVKTNKTNIEWLVDNTLLTDTNKFHIIHIGHQQTDDNNSNPRFATDAWIYIDSSKSKIYEYDLTNDSLIFYR